MKENYFSFINKKYKFALAIVFGFLFFSLSTFSTPTAYSAAPPVIITYQGRLLQNNSNVTSTQTMGFLIYNASTNGSLLYTASGTTASTSTIEVDFSTASAGNFTVQFGGTGTNPVTSTIFAENESLYLEVWVEGVKLSPRRRLTSAPYAINSQYLMGVSASSTSSTTYIPHSNSYGNFTFTGNAQSTAVGGGLIYINPTSTDPDETLFGIALNDSERFRVDEDGDSFINGELMVSSTLFVSSSLGFVGINSSSPNYALSVNGTSYFSATSTFAHQLNVEGKLRNPTILSSLSPSSGTVYDVKVSGDYAYLAGLGGGMYIYDITNPNNPVLVKRVITPSNTETIEIVGNYVYVGTSGSVMLVIDVTNPAAAFIAGQVDFGGAVTDFKVVGNLMYVIGNSEFYILDISDPIKPVTLGTDSAGGATYLDVSGNFVYISDQGFQVVRILDVATPTQPVQVGAFTPSGTPDHILISGKFLYLSDTGGRQLAIYDISNPPTPVLVASLDPGGFGSADGKAISGNYLYLAYGTTGVHVIDITSSTNPIQITRIASPTIGQARRIDVQGNFIYWADRGGGMHIVDVGGAEVAHAKVGTIDAHNVHVRNRSIFDGNVLATRGINIGSGGILINGGLAMTASTSTVNATNTLSFSHAAVFESNVTTTYSNAFVFNTRYTLTSATTTYLLSVRNNDTPVFSVSANGEVVASGTFYGQGGSFGTPGVPGDLAEQVDIAIDDTVEAGDVIIVDPSAPDTYRRSQVAYERAVAGVISTNPTITIGYGKTSNTALLAMVGRVPIKVTAENGPILRGDILVSASKPGYAMKYDPTKDDGIRVVGIIGVALDPLPQGEGKILSLVKSGWINNRNQTVSEIQQDLIELAQVDGIDINTEPVDLLVAEDGVGQIGMISENLNLNGYYIVNVAGIYGKSNKWRIDDQGRFVTQVKTSEGDKTLYALQSEKTEYVFSGSGTLQNGTAEIVFPTSTREILDPEKNIRVSVTLTSEANGVYIMGKSTAGFTVKELLAGVSNATFDWVVIAERKLGDLVEGAVEIPQEEPPLLENNEVPDNALPQDPINPEPVILEEVDPVVGINNPIEENHPAEVLPEPVVPEPVVPEADPLVEVPPEVPVDAAPAPEPVEVAPEPVPEAPAPDPAV